MIVIDARPLQNTPLTGVGLVTQELIKRIKKPTLTLFTSGIHKPQFETKNHIHTSIPNKLLTLATLITKRPTIEQLIAQHNNEPVDAVFLPNCSIINTKPKTPLIITIHDLSFLHITKTYAIKNRWWHYAVNIKKLAHRAQNIIAVSQTTAKDIVETLGIPEEKITVIHPGIEKQTSVLQLPQIPEKYLLILSSIEPRKNLEILIRPLRDLLQQPKFSDVHVILLGVLGFQGKKILNHFTQELGTQRFHYLGYVQHDIKQALIAHAYATLYPSRFEGFGLPPLEGGIQGVPAIVSRIPSLQETLEETAWYADPYRSDEWYEAIKTMLENQNLHREMSEKIKKQAEKFSWDTTITQYEKLLQTYEHRY